jgi:ring-1,2-phenylacetyl-CoA epoxidase subunit PaaC
MPHFAYVLHLADNCIILGQRNAQWCGNGPILEEDIAMANNSLDLIGQARMLYQYAAELKGGLATEDSLAYFRDAHDFKNYTLLELPHYGPLVGYAVENLDYSVTIVRNFLFSTLMVLMWEKLQHSKDTRLAAIAAKSLKEVRYHLRHAHDWLVRFGDGTHESQARAQAALNHLMPYTQEFWIQAPFETAAYNANIGIDTLDLKKDWTSIVGDTLNEANLMTPPGGGYLTSGKLGLHSEHLSYLLGEMQSIARAHPDGVW